MQDFPAFARMAGFGEEEWRLALSVWQARSLRVPSGEAFVRQGQPVRDIYVVQGGMVHVLVDDYWGNRSVLSVVEEGRIFGAAYAFAGVEVYPISALAVGDAIVVAVPVAAFLASADTHPTLYAKAQSAFLHALAERSVSLIHTIEQVKQRTLRQKILAYLSYCGALARSTRFTVPLNRQQMADYLAADRASLCRELARLRDEGLIAYHKNEFRLYLRKEP